MKSILIILFLTFETSLVFCQNTNNCSCEGLVDINYKNLIDIYKIPFGQIKYKIKQDFKNEDFLTFSIDKDSANFFHLTFSFSISGKDFTGWVKKANYLGIYSRVYSDTLKLYSMANLKSPINMTIATWTNTLLPIYACKDKWVFIKYSENNRRKEGWVQDKDQCSNPYTICN
jgi:hypothetical protein